MIAIASAILRDTDGKYLLVQEKKESVHGLWGLPGGWADEAESLRQAAIRETKEEVGLEIEIDGDLPIYDLDKPELDRHFYAFLGTIKSGEVTIDNSELLAAQWYSFDDIKSLYTQARLRSPWAMAAIERAENAYSRD